MQLTASKPAVYAWSVCRRERMLRGMPKGSRQLILCLVRPVRRALFFAFLLSSCVDGVVPSGATPAATTSPASRKLCEVHHIRLTTINGWWDGNVTILSPVDEVAKKYVQRHPHRIWLNESRVRSSKFTIPKKITFCRLCEQDVGRDL